MIMYPMRSFGQSSRFSQKDLREVFTNKNITEIGQRKNLEDVLAGVVPVVSGTHWATRYR